MDQEQQTIGSLFDYLYIDKRRLNHWLAQLDKRGLLTSFKRNFSEGSESSSAFSLDGNAAVVKAGANGASKDSYQESHERLYESEWSRPSLLLDNLDQHGFIERDILDARIGQLVLFSGRVQLLDLGFLQRAWDGLQKLAKANTSSRLDKEAAKNMSMMRDLIKNMPSDPQIYVKNSSNTLAWSILEEDYITGSPTSIALSSGSNLNGEWNVLGILDGLPDYEIKPPENFSSSDLSDPIAQMVATTKGLIGRSVEAYSITPILVFRSVSKRS